MARLAVLIALVGSVALSQEQPVSPSSPGVTPVWELRKQIAALVEQAKRLAPILDQVKPSEWPPEAERAYREQHSAVRKEIEYLAGSATLLARDPEKMPLALDSFLRLNTLERTLDSLSEGVRRYQNPALAELIQGVISENSLHRNRLQAYLVELVATKQDELRIATEEAQSCRAAQLRIAPPRAPRQPVSAAPKPAPAPAAAAPERRQ